MSKSIANNTSILFIQIQLLLTLYPFASSFVFSLSAIYGETL